MTPEEIRKAINEAVANGLQEHLPLAVSTAVTASVNGKIDGLRKELQPITDAYKTWLTMRRMSVVTFGIFLAIGGIIQAAQAVWGIVAGHLVIK